MSSDVLRLIAREVVDQLVRGDYESLFRRFPSSRLTTEDVRRPIRDYGRRLVSPPSETRGRSSAEAGTIQYGYGSLKRVTDVYEGVGQPETRQTHTAYGTAGNVIAVTTGLASDPAYAHSATTAYQYASRNRKIEEDD